MDLASTTSPAPSAAPIPPNSGYYTVGGAVFYVTSNAGVFLLRSDDEPVCLHQIDRLPAEAVLTTARMGPRLALLARTAEDLCKPTGPLSLARVEVRRDRIVALGASLQAVLTCALEDIGSVLVEEASPDSESFFDRVTARLRTIDEQSRRLSSERHQRRGERENAPSPSPHVPLAAAPYVHRGEFVGTYWDLATAGAQLAGPFPGKSEAVAVMRDAHLRGTLWTLPDNGVVHVFRCPEPDSGLLSTE